MDFGHALMVTALLFALVEMTKAVIPAVAISRRWTILAVLVLAEVSIFGLRYTVWAHEQVVGGHPLDELNFGSLVVAGLFLAAGSSFVAEVIKAIKNVGENQPEKPIAK